jgi:dTMP kinase
VSAVTGGGSPRPDDEPHPGDEFVTLLHLEDEKPGLHVRMFGSSEFFRLWLAQVVSATGDWLGLLAISLLAIRLGTGSEGAALSLVLAARIVPGFFFGPVAGVLVDRWDRKRVMVTCDIGRALVMVALPFVNSIFGLFLASLALEAFTMLWSPAKEASVPNLVEKEYLATANSLSLVAAYGTFPVGAALMALFGRLSTALFSSSWADNLRLDDMGLAFYFNSLSFLVTAVLIATLALPKRLRAEKDAARGRRARLADPIAELKEGWQFIFVNPVVRTVNMGLATGLIGGGMLIPLGAIYADEVLGAGKSGLGVLISALGVGVAAGVALLSWVQRRVDKARLFTWSLIGSGVFLAAAASISQVHLSTSMVFGIGVCAGSVYVLGFTLIHENVEDNLRGRIFSTLYLLVRACVLLALVVGPLIEDGLDRLSNVLWDRHIEVVGMGIDVPGVRLTLWLAALIILASGAGAVASLRGGSPGMGIHSRDGKVGA